MFKRVRKYFIDRKQADINKKYERFGMSDELLDEQIKLNIKRNKHDIPDETEFIHEEFVQ